MIAPNGRCIGEVKAKQIKINRLWNLKQNILEVVDGIQLK